MKPEQTKKKTRNRIPPHTRFIYFK